MELRHTACNGGFLFHGEPDSASGAGTPWPAHAKSAVANSGETSCRVFPQAKIVQTATRRQHHFARLRETAFSLLLALRFSFRAQSDGREWLYSGRTLPRWVGAFAGKATAWRGLSGGEKIL